MQKRCPHCRQMTEVDADRWSHTNNCCTFCERNEMWLKCGQATQSRYTDRECARVEYEIEQEEAMRGME